MVRRIRVLQSFTAPTADDNPFIALTAGSVGALADSAYFSWRRALLGRYDVLHLHWLDPLASGRSRPETLARWVGACLLLLRLQVTRTPVVRTLHNRGLRGSDGRRIVRWILGRFDALTTITIVMNHASAGEVAGETAYVPHGHYRPWYEQHDLPAPVSGRLLNFGLVRAYKGLDTLVESFGGLGRLGVRLHVVGRVLDQEVADRVRAAAVTDDRLAFVEGHVSDADLAREIGEAEVVVLPYDDLFNSGCLLLSLSLGRPVLVPECAASRELAEEFGPDWVLRYAAPLRPGDLDRALAAARAADRPPGPDLSRRDWDLIGAQTVEVYRLALGRAPAAAG